MLKKEIKNIFSEIPLYCIASFVIGAYTVLLINFFWFDNHITPPGVSAFVASMALLFTIYAAFKVKAWSEQKMNDKAFGVAEDIIKYINESYVEFMFASSYLSQLTEKQDNSKIFQGEANFKTYAKHFQASTDAHLKSINLIDTLPIWKYDTPYRDVFYRFRNKTKEYNEIFFKAFEIASSASIDRTQEFRTFDRILKSKRKEVKSVYEELTSLTFDEIFVYSNKKKA